jgi:glycosyltransferase involved in cell wall biosynthesis
MKIVFTMTLAERLGGSEAILWTVLRNLDRNRFEPAVFFLADGPFEREVAALGVPTAVVHPGRMRIRDARQAVRAVRALAALLREHSPQLIVNWLPKAQIYTAPAAILAGMGDRIVWWQHDMAGRQRVDRLATILPAKAVGSDSQASAESQASFRPRRPAFAVLPGVAMPHTAPQAELEELRRRLRLPAGRPVVGIVGRLQQWKGQHRVLEALAMLRARGRDVHGLIIGGDQHIDPEYASFVRGLAPELGLEAHVTFTGQVGEPGPYFQLLDVMVNASEPEPFGLVLLEAMAIGVPVVAVDAAGPGEILDGGKYGVLTPSGSPGDLADGIERLLADRPLRERLSEQGRERYAQRFTVERMMDEMHRRFAQLGDATSR